MDLKIAFCLLSLMILTGCKSTEWTEFTSQENGFAVLLPGEPEQTSSQIETPFGPSKLSKYSVESPEALFEVACSDYPDSLFIRYTDEEILNSVCAAYTAGGRIEPSIWEEITIDGFPGREIALQSPDGQLYMKIRSYLVEHRLYQTSVITPREKSLSVSIDKFLDSFRLLNPS